MSSGLASVPRIAPVAEDAARPFWSVMIPTYNADDLLEQTLRSVLDQDPGADRMQIAVVDDRSPNGRSREIVARLAPDRVEFIEQPANVGLAGNWNTCVARARGQWVHILHQDDLVSPGFYDRLGQGVADRPEIGAAFCRYQYIDGSGNFSRTAEAEQDHAGPIEGWVARIAADQRIECPSIVVKRSVYEELGGFRADLRYILDWEMWVRIAFRHPFWYEPTVLASWREHEKSETRRLARLDFVGPDFIKGIGVMLAGAPREHRRLVVEAVRLKRGYWHLEVSKRMERGEVGQAFAILFDAYRHESLSEQAKVYLGNVRWALKAWLSRYFRKPRLKARDA